jgi:hypothetical protein
VLVVVVLSNTIQVQLRARGTHDTHEKRACDTRDTLARMKR